MVSFVMAPDTSTIRGFECIYTNMILIVKERSNEFRDVYSTIVT
jgi:hypothetical protein